MPIPVLNSRRYSTIHTWLIGCGRRRRQVARWHCWSSCAACGEVAPGKAARLSFLHALWGELLQNSHYASVRPDFSRKILRAACKHIIMQQLITAGQATPVIVTPSHEWKCKHLRHDTNRTPENLIPLHSSRNRLSVIVWPVNRYLQDPGPFAVLHLIRPHTHHIYPHWVLCRARIRSLFSPFIMADKRLMAIACTSVNPSELSCTRGLITTEGFHVDPSLSLFPLVDYGLAGLSWESVRIPFRDTCTNNR